MSAFLVSDNKLPLHSSLGTCHKNHTVSVIHLQSNCDVCIFSFRVPIAELAMCGLRVYGDTVVINCESLVLVV